ncbi:MAG: extracellular solute-binding protein, partial [Chloroflexota bacterium]
MDTESGHNRRHFLRVGGLTGAAAIAAACAPATAPAPGPTGAAAPPVGPGAAIAAWETDWNNTVDAAKKEGGLSISWTASVGGSYRPIIDDFEKAFGGIKVDLSSMNSGSLLVPKVLQEHAAGIYSYDLVFTSMRFGQNFIQNGALRPMRPLVIRPDVIEDGKWERGWEFGWVDKEKQYAYGFGMNVPLQWWMNTDLVKEGEIKSINDLLAPKFKGKIIFTDIRSGFTATQATALRLNLGEDFLKKLYQDQQPVYQRDNRLLTEAMVKGQYAIGTGVLVPVLEEFQKEGLGKNLKQFDIIEAASMNMAHQMFMLKGAPHPNATKLFINWLLTKEGQTS